MDCRETRDDIEKIEDLKKKDHRVPKGIASHLKDCENCEEYHRASGELERQLFSKIRDMKVPVVPSAASLMPPKTSPWRKGLILIPLAAAAVLLIMVGLRPYDFTREVFEKVVSHNLGIEKAYAEEISRPLQEFEKVTGLKPDLPEDFKDLKPEKACLLDIRGRKVLAMLCRREGKLIHVFIFQGQHANWDCCKCDHCKCLSNSSAVAERWKRGKLGYMTVMPGKGEPCEGCCDEAKNKQ
ncbi:hypothetical protein ACFL4W_04600 [Planctomycetota bacterium]